MKRSRSHGKAQWILATGSEVAATPVVVGGGDHGSREGWWRKARPSLTFHSWQDPP